MRRCYSQAPKSSRPLRPRRRHCRLVLRKPHLSSLSHKFTNNHQIIPICATLPPLEDLLAAPLGQVLPMIFYRVMGTQAGGIALTGLVLIVTLLCSIYITVAA